MEFTNTINQVLTHNRLSQMAPSIFSDSAREGLSDRYNFIPTINVVKELENQGWLPVKAQESRVRDENNQGYQKHMIRFRNFHEKVQDKLAVGDTFVEMVLTNSHNGLGSFIFNAGLFRLACGNGMVVSEGNFESVHVRHNSYQANNVIDITAEVVEHAPKIINKVEQMKQIELSPVEQMIFANAAKPLRFDKPQEIETERILIPQRSSDKGNDLWKTYNRVQENLVKGNVRYDRKDDNGHYQGRSHTREVKSIDGGMKLNQALWTLAEEMSKLKMAQ